MTAVGAADRTHVTHAQTNHFIGKADMTLTPEALAPIAAQMLMPPEARIVLPTAVEVFAKEADTPITDMLAELTVNAPLRNYLAEICIQTHTAA